MSQHSQRTQYGPPRWVVTGGWVTTALAFSATIWVGSAGPDMTVREIGGMCLGQVLTIGLFTWSWNRHIEYKLARVRAYREHRKAWQEAERAAEARRGATGNWTGEQYDEGLSVRYDVPSGYLMVQGRVGDFEVPEERPWFSVATLKNVLLEMEAEGQLEPVPSQGMDVIRRRLGMTASPLPLRSES